MTDAEDRVLFFESFYPQCQGILSSIQTIHKLYNDKSTISNPSIRTTALSQTSHTLFDHLNTMYITCKETAEDSKTRRMLSSFQEQLLFPLRAVWTMFQSSLFLLKKQKIKNKNDNSGENCSYSVERGDGKSTNTQLSMRESGIRLKHIDHSLFIFNILIRNIHIVNKEMIVDILHQLELLLTVLCENREKNEGDVIITLSLDYEPTIHHILSSMESLMNACQLSHSLTLTLCHSSPALLSISHSIYIIASLMNLKSLFKNDELRIQILSCMLSIITTFSRNTCIYTNSSNSSSNSSSNCMITTAVGGSSDSISKGDMLPSPPHLPSPLDDDDAIEPILSLAPGICTSLLITLTSATTITNRRVIVMSISILKLVIGIMMNDVKNIPFIPATTPLSPLDPSVEISEHVSSVLHKLQILSNSRDTLSQSNTLGEDQGNITSSSTSHHPSSIIHHPSTPLSQSQSLPSLFSPTSPQFSFIKRSSSWYSSTLTPTKTLLLKVLNIGQQHPHWAVRGAIYDLAASLIHSSIHSLSTAAMSCIDVMAIASMDEQEECREIVQSFLNNLTSLPLDTSSRLLVSICNLSQVIRRNNENDMGLLSHLKMISGYLLLLQSSKEGRDQLLVTFSLTQSIQKIIFAFLKLLEFDVSGVRVVETRHVNDRLSQVTENLEMNDQGLILPSLSYLSPSIHSYKWFQQSSVLNEIQTIFSYFACIHPISNILIDEILSVLTEALTEMSSVTESDKGIVKGTLSTPSSPLSSDTNNNVIFPHQSSISPAPPPPLATTDVHNDKRRTIGPCLLILTFLCRGCIKQNEISINASLTIQKTSSILEILLSESLLSLPLTTEDVSSSSHLSFETICQHISIQCLTIHAITAIAHIYYTHYQSQPINRQKNNYKLIHSSSLFLQRVLYPLLEKLGDPHIIISQAAYRALLTTALAAGLPSMSTLIAANTDYLADSICQKLRYKSIHKHISSVIEAILTHASIGSLLQFIEDIFETILTALDKYSLKLGHSFNIYKNPSSVTDSSSTTSIDIEYAFCRVLFIIVTVVNSKLQPPDWILEKSIKENQKFQRRGLHYDGNSEKEECGGDIGDSDSNERNLSEETVRSYFINRNKEKEYKKWNDISNMDSIDHESEENSMINEEDEEALKQQQQQHPFCKMCLLVSQILKKCIHFLSSPSRRIRLLLLKTIENGLLFIKIDKELLLPTIHTTWPSIVARMRDADKSIAVASFTTISVVFQCGGEFMTSRFIDDVLPTAKRLLLGSQSSSSVIHHPSSVIHQPSSVIHPIISNDQILSSGIDIIPSLLRNDSMILGRHSMDMKLRIAIFQCFRSAINNHICESSIVLYKLVVLSRGYLHRHCPSDLLAIVMHVFEAIGMIDANVIWLTLQQMYYSGRGGSLTNKLSSTHHPPYTTHNSSSAMDHASSIPTKSSILKHLNIKHDSLSLCEIDHVLTSSPYSADFVENADTLLNNLHLHLLEKQNTL